MKFFARPNIEPGEATIFIRRLETLAYFLFVTRGDINERVRRYASALTSLAVGNTNADTLELTKEDKKAFRQMLDGPIYEVTRYACHSCCGLTRSFHQEAQPMTTS